MGVQREVARWGPDDRTVMTRTTTLALTPLLALALALPACGSEDDVRLAGLATEDANPLASGDADGTSEGDSPPGDDDEAPNTAQDPATCWFSFSYEGAGSTQDWSGPISGTAEFTLTKASASEGGMRVLNMASDGTRTSDVRVLSLTDSKPRFAEVVFSAPESTGVDLGGTGTFEVGGGARLNAGPDVPFDVGGTLEFTITRSEYQQQDDGPIYVDAYAGTFRNVTPLVFTNPFPENGAEAEVTHLEGAFNLDRRGCPLMMP